jgi:hypothetical protein
VPPFAINVSTRYLIRCCKLADGLRLIGLAGGADLAGAVGFVGVSGAATGAVVTTAGGALLGVGVEIGVIGLIAAGFAGLEVDLSGLALAELSSFLNSAFSLSRFLL